MSNFTDAWGAAPEPPPWEDPEPQATDTAPDRDERPPLGDHVVAPYDTPAELSEEERAKVDQMEAAPAADLDADEQADQGDDVVEAEILCECSRLEQVHAWDPDAGCPHVEDPAGHDLGDVVPSDRPSFDQLAEQAPSPSVLGMVEQLGAAQERAGDGNPSRPQEPAGDVVQWVGMGEVEQVLDQLLANPRERGRTLRAATDGLLDAVRRRAAARREKRPEKVKNPADLRVELVGVSDDADVLYDMGRVFTTAADDAKAIAGELLRELPSKAEHGRASAVVADGQGFDLKVSRSVRRETSVKHEEVDDVLATWALAAAQLEHDALKAEGPAAEKRSPLALGVQPAKTYAAGVRHGIELLRTVLSSSPAYKSTALDELVKTIGGANEDELAKRLAHAYGKVEKGEPSIKLDRTPSKKADDEQGEEGQA